MRLLTSFHMIGSTIGKYLKIMVLDTTFTLSNQFNVRDKITLFVAYQVMVFQVRGNVLAKYDVF